MAARARLTGRGQVTIPKDVRARLGLQPGDEIEFVADADGFRMVKRGEHSPFARYRGYLQELAGADPDALLEELRGR